MSRAERYAAMREQLASLLVGCPDRVARMATAAALLIDAMDEVFWAGFYLPQGDGALLVGPYQGPVACMRLPPGKGVCGAAAAARATVVVPDVHAFRGHIACSPRSRSEIVVPVLRDGALLAVLDLDSDRPGAFDADDARGLVALAAIVAC
jgi:GAF domain-containing protein